MRLFRLSVSALVCLVAAAAGAQSPPVVAAAPAHAAYPAGEATPLGAQIAALLADPAVARAHWGIAVTEMDGTPIYGLDEGKLFRPASNAKLFTTAAAMALLGPEATVTTTVTSAALPDASGLVHGDIVLNGAGDANLSGTPFPYTSKAAVSDHADPLVVLDDLAAQVVAKGVKRLSGQVIGDDTIWPTEPYPVGWEMDDMVWGYAAPVSALAVNDNQIQLTLTPLAVGQAVLVKAAPALQFGSRADQVNNAVAGPAKSATHISVDRLELANGTLRIDGSVAAGKPDLETIAVLHPAEYAAMALRSRLTAHGVSDSAANARTADSFTEAEGFLAAVHRPLDLRTIKRTSVPALPCKVVDTCVVLASHTSPTLAEDTVYTLKESQNLHAEMMLRRLGAAFGDGGRTVQGARVVRQWLVDAGLDGNDFVFYDGSGLSVKDLVTPRSTAQLLAYVAKQPWFAAWKAALPIGGVDGSLEHRFTAAPLKGHVFAKTGTLGESRALSGYVDTASGKQVIFSVFCDDHTPGSSADRTVMDKIVAAIAANH